MNEDPRIYAIAKRITLDSGCAYTDPRTGETTQPTKLSKWWRTKNAKAATKRAEKVKQERLKLLRKLAQSKKKSFDNPKQVGKVTKSKTPIKHQ